MSRYTDFRCQAFDINLNKVPFVSQSDHYFICYHDRFATNEEYRTMIMDIVNTRNYFESRCIVTNIRMKTMLET